MTAVTTPSTVRITGTIAALRIADVSKRAGVENFKSYVRLDVESVEPAELHDRLGGSAEFVRDGKLDLAVGTRVELETHVGAPNPGRLRIYRIAAL